MKILTIKIILALIFLNCSVSFAQYNEYFRFTDVRGTMVYDCAMRSVINEDAKVMQRNNVRSVTVADESGTIQNKMSFNKEGRITNFSSYEYNEGEEISYEIQWSEDSKIQKIYYKEFGKTAMSFVYDFYYKESMLDYISVDFGLGLSENYIFTYGKNNGDMSVEKISYKDNYKDTVYMEQLFNYNNNGSLVNVKDTKFESTLDSVDYEGNILGINTKYFRKRKFEIKDNRIISEITIIPSLQVNANANNQKKEIPDMVSTKYYFYKENGLIDYITNDKGELSLKTIYTYEYYDR